MRTTSKTADPRAMADSLAELAAYEVEAKLREGGWYRREHDYGGPVRTWTREEIEAEYSGKRESQS